MSDDEVVEAARDLREVLQERTCCPDHAMEIALMCAASFALDGTKPQTAARLLDRQATHLVGLVHDGSFTLARHLNG